MNYYLDGGVPAVASSDDSVAPGTYTVTAEPKDPDDGTRRSPDEWEFGRSSQPAATASCDLTTLALTGAGANPLGWAGIGYYLLVTGLALIAVRTVRRRNEVKQ